MKKVLAALVAAAFSLSIAGTAMAVPAQVSQQHSPITQVQADKTDQGTTKKKKTTKKTGKKKQPAKTAKKAQKKSTV
jgi:Flp pilus assembly protein TadB